MSVYPSGISASDLQAAIRAQLEARGLGKDDLDRCGVAVADVEREVIRWFVTRGRGRIAEVMDELVARLGLDVPAPAER